METDFHYYAIYQLSRLAGYSDADARTISYPSPYVDNSTESEPIRPFNDQYFDTARTAHYNWEVFKSPGRPYLNWRYKNHNKKNILYKK